MDVISSGWTAEVTALFELPQSLSSLFVRNDRLSTVRNDYHQRDMNLRGFNTVK